MRKCGKKQTFVVRISSCQNDTQIQPSSTRSTEVAVQEISGIEQKISEYRRRIRRQRNWGVVFRTTTMLLCAAAFVLVLTTVAGWCDQLKVEDTLSKALLIVVLVILLSVATLVGYNMTKNRGRYNAALARMDSLILRLMINVGEDISPATINRELQLIARMLGVGFPEQ